MHIYIYAVPLPGDGGSWARSSGTKRKVARKKTVEGDGRGGAQQVETYPEQWLRHVVPDEKTIQLADSDAHKTNRARIFASPCLQTRLLLGWEMFNSNTSVQQLWQWVRGTLHVAAWQTKARNGIAPFQPADIL